MGMNMEPRAKATLIMITLLVIGLTLGYLVAVSTFPKLEKRIEDKFSERAIGAIRQIYVFKNIIVMVNISLLFSLLVVYIHSFLRTSSSFLLGLSVFIGVLLVQSVLSLPVLYVVFATLPSFSLIGTLQDIFEMTALIILFYLSME